jgi:hypothetical protein
VPRYPQAAFAIMLRLHGRYRGFGVQVGSSYHNGANLWASIGSNVYAVTDCMVVIAGLYNGFGSMNPDTKAS